VLLGSDRLPLLAGRKSDTDNPTDQGAKWWPNEELDNPKSADVGVKRTAGSCVVYYRDAEAGQCPKHKAVAEMSTSRGSAMNFEPADFASAVSQSITVCTSLYDERVGGKLAQMTDSRKAVCSHHESNRGAMCNC
jgi:hypothetical protein